MASRTDVEVTYADSPRVAEIAAPSTDINMQDLVDTLRDAEYSWAGNTSKKLLNASGKEDLGGGVRVGITAALQNLLLAFEGRTTPAETGTVTSNPGSVIVGRDQFVDTSADFVTAAVARGSLVINFTDQSVAEVVSVDDLNTLTTKTLVNGIGNTYDVADVYHVFNIIQCKADGGNLVAVDEAQATVAAILPTAFTQVTLTSSSSATISEQIDIRHASFEGAVHIDDGNQNGNAQAGTEFPVGTPRVPVDNFADALLIADINGFQHIQLMTDATLPAGPDFTGYIFVGKSKRRTTLTVPTGATVDNCEFDNMSLTGTLDGVSLVVNCTVYAILDFDGEMDLCGLSGDVTLNAGGFGEFINCHSEVAGDLTPKIDVGTAACLGRDYSGGIEFINKTGTAAFSWDMDSGQIIVADTCTAGSVTLRGVAKWANKATYAGTTTVNNELLTGTDLQSLRKLMQNRMETDPTTGIMTIYDDDDVTVFMTGNIFEDVLAAQIYRGRGMERRDRLS